MSADDDIRAGGPAGVGRDAGPEAEALRPFSDAQARSLLHRYMTELKVKPGGATPEDMAKIALLMEFSVDDD